MELANAKLSLDHVVSKGAAARLRAFRMDAERLFPGRVADVILFGSRARGEAKRHSDYDVAVFVKGLRDIRSATHALSDAAHAHMLRGVYISPIGVDADFLERHSSGPLRHSIARDGVRIR